MPSLRKVLHKRRARLLGKRYRTTMIIGGRHLIEQLERRDMLAQSDWTNVVQPLNVSGDIQGFVSPLDALIVINELNEPRVSDPLTGKLRDVGDEATTPPHYDVDGDGYVSPIDALRVINFLNEAAKGSLPLNEGPGVATEHSTWVTLGQTQGVRHYRLQIDASFEPPTTSALVPDLFSVYLVDPNNPSQTLLDRGENGTSLFSLSSRGAEMALGPVRWDGNILDIELTSFGNRDTGLLKLQLLNGDGSSRARVTVTPLSNEVDEEGPSAPRFPVTSTPIAPGPSVDLSTLTASTTLQPIVENVRYNTATGQYNSEIRLRNDGDPIGRTVAIVFPNLPAGVNMANASGIDATGSPYLNLRNAIRTGGLGRNDSTSVNVELKILDPDNRHFSLEPRLLVGGPNRAPSFSSIAPLAVMPGNKLVVTLLATDADGDPLTFSINSSDPLPTVMLDSAGYLSISPTPDQLGEYSFALIASDGLLQATQTVRLSVIPDPVTTTRVTGVIQNTAQQALEGVQIEIGSSTTTTAVDGSFVVEFSGPLPSDTIKVRGESIPNLPPDLAYPFIAEKLPLVLEHEVFVGVNNVITRPIYLPPLNEGTAIDAAQSITVVQQLRPGEDMAMVQADAGSLRNQTGNPFVGKLGITEVPREVTPAALPVNLMPDLVVTIQPGEMVFVEPARLTLPNRAGWATGTKMDLWSINPITGLFDNVGTGEVSSDGLTVHTISGGIRNSSWHFFTPQLEDPQDETIDLRCGGQGVTQEFNSEVDLSSGAMLETHDLATYFSLGQQRGLTLRYDSERANPQATLGFTLRVGGTVGPGNQTTLTPTLLKARAVFRSGNISWTVGDGDDQEFLGDLPLLVPSDLGNRVGASLRVALQDVPTGTFSYELHAGAVRRTATGLTGAMFQVSGQIVSVNSRTSPFGVGWGLAGLREIIESQDGSALLVDGGGTEFLFRTPVAPGEAYVNPPGHFGTLVKLPDGTFRHTMTDQTSYSYNQDNKLALIRDRNANETQFEYTTDKLTKITDSVGLATSLQYNGNRISSITDPAGRVTRLFHDAAGNLQQVVDPDIATRTWAYDSQHLMTSELTSRGDTEFVQYDEHGLAKRAVRADGATVSVVPAAARGLLSRSIRNDAVLFANSQSTHVATYVDANGGVTDHVLDAAGQFVSGSDAQGPIGVITRNSSNLIIRAQDGRRNVTSFAYDDNGNLIDRRLLVLDGSDPGRGGLSFPGRQIAVDGQELSGAVPSSSALADLNGDGRLDLVTANGSGKNVSVLLGSGGGGFADPTNFAAGNSPIGVDAVAISDLNGDGQLDLASTISSISFGGHVSVLLGDGNGGFAAAGHFRTMNQPDSIAIGDLNSDAQPDIVTADRFDDKVSILLGNGSGGFGDAIPLAVTSDAPRSVALRDLNSDGRLDLIIANDGSDNVSVLLGNGSGGFAPSAVFAAGDRPRSVAIADVNGDNNLDLITANNAGNSVSILLGDGTGEFAIAVSHAVGDGPESVAIDDVNGDGSLDVVTGNSVSNNVSVLLGDGEGKFAEPIHFDTGVGKVGPIALADMDTDNQSDVIVAAYAPLSSSYAVVLFGSGDGTFETAARLGSGNTPASVAAGDLNGDGHLDVVTANSGSNDVSILFANDAGSFDAPLQLATGIGPISVALADLNGDGQIDIATANISDSSVSVILGGGNRVFASAANFGTGIIPASIAIGDINEDGRMDLVTANLADSVSVLLGDGRGAFGERMNFAVDVQPRSVAISDLNGDGHLDLATANFSDTVSVLLGNGAGGFAIAVSHMVGDGPEAVAIDDVNGDERLDVVTANSGSDNVSVLLGNGNGGFAPSAEFPAGGAFSRIFEGASLAIADLNEDGYRDIVAGYRTAGNVCVLLGDGFGGFSPPLHFVAGLGAQAVATGDLDDDGREDIVTANYYANDVSVLLSNPNRSPGATIVSTKSKYDSTFSQPTSRTDGRGNTVTFDIDPANGNVRAIHRPEEQHVRYTYLPNGRTDTLTDPLNRVTDYEYNAHGRTTSVTYAKGTADQAHIRYEYDGAGNVSAFIDENDHPTVYSYDAMNRLTLVRDALGNETSYKYDKVGNVVEIRDAANHTTTYDYDGRNRLARITDFQSNITTFTYDGEGNVIQVRDSLGHVTRHRYDARNRRVETIDPDGGRTLFRYDTDNNLISLTDPVGNRTLFFYDARNRLWKETDPLNKSIIYKYDGADNLVEKKDRNGRIRKYEYDGLDRLTKEIWVGGNNEVIYQYDVASNLLSVDDSFSSLVYTYDARDRVNTVDNRGSLPNGTPGAPRVVLDYDYDPAGNVLSLIDTINGAAGATTSYVYDVLDRLSVLTQSGPGLSEKRVDFTYNALGQYDHVKRFSDLAGNQLVIDTAYGYDSLNRLRSIDHNNQAGSAVSFFHYDFDSASRITQIADVDGVTTYGYDDRDQLTSAEYTDTRRTDETYDYDANGNRVESHLHGTGYVTDRGNRLRSDGIYNYEYDDEGNTILRTRISGTEPDGSVVREFMWDHRNRLTSVTDKKQDGTAAQIVQFTYDALDRRISKSVDNTPTDAADAAIMHFVYDREDVILDLVDSDGTLGPAVPTVSQRYLHGPGIDQVLAQDNASGQTHWHLADHLGTIRDLASAAGAIDEHLKYDSFGQLLSPSSSRYAFTGREFDIETDLHFYRSRYYDSASGAFLSEDWLGLATGDTNYRRYVANRPLGFADPMGMDVWISTPGGAPLYQFGNNLIHQNINVGDPNGEYVSFSFGATGGATWASVPAYFFDIPIPTGIEGQPYVDDRQGNLFGDVRDIEYFGDYIDTTPLEDLDIQRFIIEQIRSGKYDNQYGLTNNCRTWCKQLFDMIRESIAKRRGLGCLVE